MLCCVYFYSVINVYYYFIITIVGIVTDGFSRENATVNVGSVLRPERFTATRGGR